ncbi:MAG: hypothetical protein ABSE95_03730 [Thermodesulfobacteriota bacterium]
MPAGAGTTKDGKGFKGSRILVKGVEVKPAVPRRGTFSIARRSRAAEPWNPRIFEPYFRTKMMG